MPNIKLYPIRNCQAGYTARRWSGHKLRLPGRSPWSVIWRSMRTGPVLGGLGTWPWRTRLMGSVWVIPQWRPPLAWAVPVNRVRHCHTVQCSCPQHTAAIKLSEEFEPPSVKILELGCSILAEKRFYNVYLYRLATRNTCANLCRSSSPWAWSTTATSLPVTASSSRAIG